ncbi:hypothetical protein L2E82_08243 [Cichorium intybus]|uniref:Uncharacterized protein n=1 Tax=Cichorium intybus TaxID=13427 RepID=A0ACB9G748_CICIN|nr:hypothetical protein L2E82_08243 [Cichorium intybus]
MILIIDSLSDIIFSTFAIHKMPKKSSSKPPKKLPVPNVKPSSTSKSFGQEIEDIFSKKRKKPEPQKIKKKEGVSGNLDKERGKDRKYDEPLGRKKLKNKSGGSNVEMFEKEESSRPKRKTGDGLVIYSEEELGIGKADAGGTRLCPFDCDCCF